MEKNYLIIDKPIGWTSFDVVGFVRKKLRGKNPDFKNVKVGHAGTLDPFASGVLIVGVGRAATKRLDEFKNLPKKYEATVRLGAVSTTDDIDGVITEKKVDAKPDLVEIERVLKTLSGKQLQIPPMYSAKKINGTRLYKLARQGKEVERTPVEVEIFSIKLLDYSFPRLKIEISCSAGTYIRTIAKNIGERLNTGGYCEALTRTAIGEHTLNMANSIEEVPLMLDKIESV